MRNLVIVFLVLLVSAPHLAQAFTRPDPLPVQYVPVAGAPWLQAIVRVSNPTFSEFRTAEMRWLAKNYPGASAQWGGVLLLQGTRTRTVHRDTVYVQPPDGDVVRVCFDVRLEDVAQP